MLRCPSVRSSRFLRVVSRATPCVINLGLFVSFLLMGWVDHMRKRGLLGDTGRYNGKRRDSGRVRRDTITWACHGCGSRIPRQPSPSPHRCREGTLLRSPGRICSSMYLPPGPWQPPRARHRPGGQGGEQSLPRLRDRESCIRASKSTGARARSRRQGTCRAPPHFVSETKAGDPDEWQPRGDLYPDDGIFFLLPIVESSLELFKSIRYD